MVPIPPGPMQPQRFTRFAFGKEFLRLYINDITKKVQSNMRLYADDTFFYKKMNLINIPSSCEILSPFLTDQLFGH